MDLVVSNKLPIFALDINHIVWKMISDSYTYDLSGNPQKIYFTNGSITKYVYSATGQKLRMVHSIRPRRTSAVRSGSRWS